MKVNCKKCGKRFDPDIYSRLCPKCGAYNSMSAASQASFNGMQADNEHKKLHESYDSGYGNAHPWEDGYTYKKSEKPGRPAEKTVRDKKGLKIAAVIFLPILCIVVINFIYGRIYEKKYIGEVMTDISTPAQSVDADTLILAGQDMEYPIEVTLEGAAILETEEGYLPAGKKLAVLKLTAYSEGYNIGYYFSDYCLKYETDGGFRYRDPVEHYYLEDLIKSLGLSDDDFYTTYGSLGERKTGYCFYMIEDDATALELYVAVHEGDSPWRTVSDGRLLIADTAVLDFDGEVYP